MSERDPVRGPIPRDQARDRRAGRDPPRGVKPGAPRRAQGCRQRAQRRPLHALEEPEQAQRRPEDQARPDPADQQAALPRLPHLPAATRDLPRPLPAGSQTTRRVACLGPALPACAVRQARQDDHQPTSRDRSGDSARLVEHPDRTGEYPATAHHPPRLRASHSRSPDRPGHAQPRRALPTPTPMTPGNSTRSTFPYIASAPLLSVFTDRKGARRAGHRGRLRLPGSAIEHVGSGELPTRLRDCP